MAIYIQPSAGKWTCIMQSAASGTDNAQAAATRRFIAAYSRASAFSLAATARASSLSAIRP